MKNIHIAGLFFSFCSSLPLSAQTITPTVGKNCVVTTTMLRAGITSEAMLGSAAVYYGEKNVVISYLDGLGRPLQTVEPYITSTFVDLTDNGVNDRITSFEYDGFGRETKKYLPYTRPAFYTSFDYDPDWKTNQATYYTTGGLHGAENSTTPYSQTVFEPSPLNRPLAQGAPGTDWQPNLADPYDASKKVVKVKYEINTVTDNVRIFLVDASTRQISSAGSYSAGLLSVKTSIDEHGGVVKEFTDKTGHLILKQVYIENDVLQTYYIYDAFDLLSAVIQPEGVAAIPASGNWTPDAAFTANWMFLYNYDARKRMISKKVPGAKPVTMVYDQWDRLVLTQDGNMLATNTWLFTKYDILNRPVMTGSIVSTSPSGLATEIAGAGRFESVDANTPEGYTLTNSFPGTSLHTLTIYTVTHYDSYSNLPSWSSGYSYVNDYPLPYNTSVQGQVVGTQTRVLGTSNWLKTVLYYDDKYRIIQTISDNIATGKERISNYVLFDGKLLNKRQTHSSQVYSTPVAQEDSYTYNTAGQIRYINRNINGEGQGHREIIGFNDAGQVITKRLEYQSATSYLQKLDYSYNIRGWITGINQPYADGTGYDETDLFNFKLNYNTTDLQNGVAQFNGNIAEQVWKGGYDEYLRGYKYGYDKANRLLTADYGFKYLNSANSPAWDFTMKYNESILDVDNGSVNGYDRNGNIKFLQRYHGTWDRVDKLYYNYKDASNNPTGNRLMKVIDGEFNPKPVGFQDQDSFVDDYQYDDNGSMTGDFNKGIGSIIYNYLNLPVSVDFGAKGTIDYLYDGAGTKLQKTVTDKTVSPYKISITKYAGAFVYTNSYLSGTTPPAETLEFIGYEEGRIRPVKIDPAQALTAANTKYIYDYFMKDHLGNTRMVLTTEQQTDVYAATQEPANAAKENLLFNNVSSTTITKPGGFDSDGNNTKVSRLNGGAAATRVGPSIILKVMAGDIISIGTKAWYSGNTAAVPTGLDPLKDQLLNILTSGILANNGSQHGAIPVDDITGGSDDVLTDFLSNSQPYNNSRPKAFLNWIIVDEEFKKVTSPYHMGAVQVPAISGTMEQQALVGPANMTVRRNGWLYVYLSNESNQDVYFDNLVINHQRGPVVEQNNYYPFGLEIPGLHSQAIGFGGDENRFKFNGGNEQQSNEFRTGSGLETYDATNRMYDPQIGRFFQVDELGEVALSWSPYSFANDNPVEFNDPLGLEAEDANAVHVRKKHGFTQDDPNNLTTVTVTAKHTTVNLINSYWFYRMLGGGLNNAPKDIQNWLNRYDRTERFMEGVHADAREFDRNAAELAMYLIPIPGLGELKIVSRFGSAALKLFKLKRGITVVRTGTHLVYQGIDAAGVIRYVGITGREASERFLEHLASIGTGKELLNYSVIEGSTQLGRTEARVLEQKLINQYGLGRDGGQLLNKINSIAEKNWERLGVNN